jgi:hypothetical protein
MLQEIFSKTQFYNKGKIRMLYIFVADVPDECFLNLPFDLGNDKFLSF